MPSARGDCCRSAQLSSLGYAQHGKDLLGYSTSDAARRAVSEIRALLRAAGNNVSSFQSALVHMHVNE
jgi:hypothetical protein